MGMTARDWDWDAYAKPATPPPKPLDAKRSATRDHVEYFYGVGYVAVNTSGGYNIPYQLDPSVLPTSTNKLAVLAGQLRALDEKYRGERFPEEAADEWNRLIEAIADERQYLEYTKLRDEVLAAHRVPTLLLGSERAFGKDNYDRQREVFQRAFERQMEASTNAHHPAILTEGVKVEEVRRIVSCPLCHSESWQGQQCGTGDCLGLTDGQWAERETWAWWDNLYNDNKYWDGLASPPLPVEELERKLDQAWNNPPKHGRSRTILR